MLIVEPRQVLEKISHFPLRAFERGDIVLSEGSDTHRLLFLNRGVVDVVKDEVQLTRVSEPGAVFGDMSVLLGQPHTADVLAVAPSSFYIVDHAEGFLRQEPLVALYVATVLARPSGRGQSPSDRGLGPPGGGRAAKRAGRDAAQDRERSAGPGAALPAGRSGRRRAAGPPVMTLGAARALR